jgi:hypothetical protein
VEVQKEEEKTMKTDEECVVFFSSFGRPVKAFWPYIAVPYSSCL